MGYKRSCKGKIVYHCERKAIKAANNHNYAYNECDHAVQPYYCPFCGKGFHLGRVMNETFKGKKSQF